MKTTAYFSDALSIANTAIAQAKLINITDITIIEEKMANVIFPELVNIKTEQLFASFAKCNLENLKSDNEVFMTMRENILVLICELIMKEALSLYKLTSSSTAYNNARLIWHTGDFKSTKRVKVKNDDGGKKFQTDEELAKLEEDAQGDPNDCGDACKI